jgi:hypothetical protein
MVDRGTDDLHSFSAPQAMQRPLAEPRILIVRGQAEAKKDLVTIAAVFLRTPLHLTWTAQSYYEYLLDPHGSCPP